MGHPMKPLQVQKFSVRVVLEVMAMKGYSTLSRSPEKLFSVIPRREKKMCIGHIDQSYLQLVQDI